MQYLRTEIVQFSKLRQHIFSHEDKEHSFETIIASLIFDEFSSGLSTMAIDSKGNVWMLNSWASQSQPIDFNFTAVLSEWKNQYKITSTIVGTLGNQSSSDRSLNRFIKQAGEDQSINKADYFLPNEGLIELQQLMKAERFDSSAHAGQSRLEELLRVSIRTKTQNVQCLAFLQGICECSRLLRSEQSAVVGGASW